MVGGHRIAQQREDAGAGNVLDHGGRPADVIEERWMLDVGRIRLPDVSRGLRHFDGLPLLVAGEHFGVLLVEHRGVDLLHGFGDFLAARPDIAQVHQVAVLVFAQRLGAEVDAHGARQCIGDHQRRGGQPVGFHQRMHPALKVAVAR